MSTMENEVRVAINKLTDSDPVTENQLKERIVNHLLGKVMPADSLKENWNDLRFRKKFIDNVEKEILLITTGDITEKDNLSNDEALEKQLEREKNNVLKKLNKVESMSAEPFWDDD